MEEFFEVLDHNMLARLLVFLEVWGAFALGYATCYFSMKDRGSE